jgi:Icc-related predicted phosphoesterase
MGPITARRRTHPDDTGTSIAASFHWSSSMASHNGNVTRVAALGDLHCTEASAGLLQGLFSQVAELADILCLCGDLTDHGFPAQAQVLAKELSSAAHKVPTIAVLGNHDYESGHADEIRRILSDAGVTVLDGDAVEIRGVGFAGAKGFCGGFGRGTLSAFGEPAVKAFVREAIDEALKLETALQRLRTPHRIAILHYAPIRGTVEGEPLEIYPYLGCSRLEEPINRLAVTAVVHGHAHRGSAEGRTAAGVPVYNVSMPILRAIYPNRPPFRILALQVDPAAAEKSAASPAGAAAKAGTAATKPTEAPIETPVPTAAEPPQ